MTDREKAIVMAYTGISMFEGDKLNVFYRYLAELYGRPVYTHELIVLDIKHKSKPDFLKLCDEEDHERKKGKWIPVSERLPEEYGEYRITWATSYSKKRFVGDAEYEVTGEWDAEHDRFKGEWLLDDYIKNYPDVNVLAWKPLEEPYREEGEQDG